MYEELWVGRDEGRVGLAEFLLFRIRDWQKVKLHRLLQRHLPERGSPNHLMQRVAGKYSVIPPTIQIVGFLAAIL